MSSPYIPMSPSYLHLYRHHIYTYVTAISTYMSSPCIPTCISSPYLHLCHRHIYTYVTTISKPMASPYTPISRPSHLQISGGPKMARAALSRRVKDGHLR